MKKTTNIQFAISTTPGLPGPGTAIGTSETNRNNPAQKAILVVSFGTSYNNTRARTIDAIETAIAAAFPGYEVRCRF